MFDPNALSAYHLSDDSSQKNFLVVEEPLNISIPPSSEGVPVVKFELRVIILSANKIVSVFTLVCVPVTFKLPVMFNVVPSKVRLLSTVAFGAVPFNVINPLSVVPVKDNAPELPLEPEDPLEPLLPLEPDEPEDPLEPLEPLDPLLPLEPLEPLEPLDPLEPLVADVPLLPLEPG